MKALRVVLALSSALQLFLVLQIIFAPADFLSGFGVEVTDAVVMLTRRASVLFFGLSLLGGLLALRADRALLSSGGAIMGVVWLILAVLSGIAMVYGPSADGIIVALCAETIFAVLLLPLSLVLVISGRR